MKDLLLAIDQGNTNTVFAIFRDSLLVGQWRITANTERTADEYAVWLHQLHGVRWYLRP